MMNVKFAGCCPTFSGVSQAKATQQKAAAQPQVKANNNAQDTFVKAKTQSAKSNVQFGGSCCG